LGASKKEQMQNVKIPFALGRTGKMFTFEHFGIEPDIICLGKGLGGGIIPFAAIVARDSYNIANDISLGHYTHEKNPLGSVAALATLNFIKKENILQKVADDEQFMRTELLQLKEQFPLIGDVHGIGLLCRIELVYSRQTKEKASSQAEKIMYDCMRYGLSFKVSQGNVLQLSPALTITRRDLQKAINILTAVLKIHSC
jgi:4-aminobutyrate aminotransferase